MARGGGGGQKVVRKESLRLMMVGGGEEAGWLIEGERLTKVGNRGSQALGSEEKIWGAG